MDYCPTLAWKEKQQQVVNKSFSLRLECIGIDTYSTIFELH